MAVTLVFLGRLADLAGDGFEAEPGPLDQVLAALDPALTGTRIKLALNGNLLTDTANIVLCDGDELAFLPPVSGG